MRIRQGQVLTLRNFCVHLLTEFGGLLHGPLDLEQGILGQVVESGIGTLQNQHRKRSTSHRGHCTYHVVDTGADIIQRVSTKHKGDGSI